MLLGGADNEDVFIVEQGGSLSGYLEGGPGGFDTLVIEGGQYGSVVYKPVDASSGSVRLDAAEISYLGLEPVNDNSVAPEKTVDGSGAANVLTIESGLDAADPIVVSGPGLETHTVTQPTQLLTVNAGNNDDTINLELFLYNTRIRIDGGTGNDTVDVSGQLGQITWIKLSDGTGLLTDGITPAVELVNVENVVGADATFVANGLPQWLEQGPGPITGLPGRPAGVYPTTGAVQAIATHPANENIIYVGTVAGGVWRSVDRGVTWQPLTDQFPSLAIGALAMSTHDADGVALTNATPVNKLVLYAGTGMFSAKHDGGLALGVMRSRDGGDTWELLASNEMAGLPVTAISATRVGSEDIVLVATNAKSQQTRDQDDNLQTQVVRAGGIFRSTDGGDTFTKNVLVAAPSTPGGFAFAPSSVTDLVADPGNNSRFYAGVIGGGVYVTANAGQSWTQVNNGLDLTSDGLDNDDSAGADDAGETATQVGRIVLAVQQSAASATNQVYAALMGPKNANALMGVFSSAAGGASWTMVGTALPPTVTAGAPGPLGTGAQPQVHPGTQGDLHFSMNVDAAGNVFIGGDQPPNIYWFNQAAGVWDSVVLANASNTRAHADSRVSVFDRFGHLLEGDDGGIYRLMNPTRPVMSAGASLTFANANPDTITRTGPGDWVTDGFAVGQRITVGGAGANNGVYTIAEVVSPTVLRLSATDNVATTGALAGKTVVGERIWESLNRNLRVTELIAASYDPLNNVIFGGSQDNGVEEQFPPLDGVDNDADGFIDEADERFFWTEVRIGWLPGDGNTVAVVPLNTDADPQFEQVRRYTMSNDLETVGSRVFGADGQMVAGTSHLSLFQSTTAHTYAFTAANPGVNNNLTVAGHGLAANTRIWAASTGTLPGGLSNITEYFVNVVDPNTITLSLTSGGPVVAIGSAGAGNHTLHRRFSGIDPDDVATFRTGFRVVPIEVNAIDPDRMLIGMQGLYASRNIGSAAAPQYDGLDTVQRILRAPAGSDAWGFSALAYGGKKAGVARENVVYAAMDNDIFVSLPTASGVLGAFTTETISGATFIRDIVLDPENYEVAYAISDNAVYKRAGADNWVLISQRLNNPVLHSIEFVNVDGEDVLLVGGAAGVFRAFDPDPGVVWTEFGSNLPNAVAYDVNFFARDDAQFDNPRNLPRDDVLLAATMGRGAWTVQNADAFLSDSPVLRIEGTTDDDDFTIRRSADEPSLVEILVGFSQVYSAPVTAIQKIEIIGDAGDDTLTIDSTHGPLNFHFGISFDAGSGTNDRLVLEGTKVWGVETDTAGDETTLTIEDTRGGATQVITYESVEDLDNSLAAGHHAREDRRRAGALLPHARFLDRRSDRRRAAGARAHRRLAAARAGRLRLARRRRDFRPARRRRPVRGLPVREQQRRRAAATDRGRPQRFQPRRHRLAHHQRLGARRQARRPRLDRRQRHLHRRRRHDALRRHDRQAARRLGRRRRERERARRRARTQRPHRSRRRSRAARDLRHRFRGLLHRDRRHRLRVDGQRRAARGRAQRRRALRLPRRHARGRHARGRPGGRAGAYADRSLGRQPHPPGRAWRCDRQPHRARRPRRLRRHRQSLGQRRRVRRRGARRRTDARTGRAVRARRGAGQPHVGRHREPGRRLGQRERWAGAGPAQLPERRRAAST